MSRPNDAPQKTRIAMVCPCCGGEVRHRNYGFDMIAVTPHLTWTKWYVCDDCAAALGGTDTAARDAAERAFAAYLEASDHAPAA